MTLVAPTLRCAVLQLSLSDFAGKWVVLFFYPKDFSGLCPTELIAFSDRAAEFEALDCQVIAASTDTAESHRAWTRVARGDGGIGTGLAVMSCMSNG